MTPDRPRLRSLLFVPGDRPDRMAKALGLGADALILDLEDAVAPPAKPAARAAVAAFVAGAPADGPAIFVRINPLGTAEAEDDLAALAGVRPAGWVQPKVAGPEDVATLAQRTDPAAWILPVTTEVPAAVFRLGDYAPVASRLAGLTWGAEDLPAAIGAETSREDDGRYTPPYELVRSLTLFGAAAAGVPPIDTVYPAVRDAAGLAAYAARAARDGFTGMMAIHPDQVAPINAAFTPSPAAVAHAQAIVDAFAAAPGAGVLQLDGRMVDRPHLVQAQRLLARAR